MGGCVRVLMMRAIRDASPLWPSIIRLQVMMEGGGSGNYWSSLDVVERASLSLFLSEGE